MVQMLGNCKEYCLLPCKHATIKWTIPLGDHARYNSSLQYQYNIKQTSDEIKAL